MLRMKGGNKQKSSKSKQQRKQNQNKNQQGGSSSNSSSVALGYGGLTPMTNYRIQGGASSLADNAAPFSAVSVPVVSVNAGNGLIKGGSVQVPVAPVVPVTAGSIPTQVVPVTAGSVAVVPAQGGNIAPMKGGSVPSMPVVPINGGNVLNDLAVPAVLLYANQTFGKKKNYTAKKNRKYKNNRRNRSRRYRRK